MEIKINLVEVATKLAHNRLLEDLMMTEEESLNQIYEEDEDSDSLTYREGVQELFDEFYELYPSYITRVDGTKDYLRSNVKQARKYYESLVGSNETLHRHIIKCLKSEISEKLITGKIGYMKRMWKWLTNHEWEIYEDRINEQPTHKQKEDLYGTEIL